MDYWKAGPDVYQQLRKIISEHHPHLLLIADEIAVVFKDKATERGGVVIPGATKKAPPMMQVLTDKKFGYRYIIELGVNTWHDFTNSQRTALLDHHLCAMRVEEDANSGELKCGLRPPDFVGYQEEVERHGMWRPMDEDVVSVLQSAFSSVSKPEKRADMDTLMEILGKDEEENGTDAD
jgi:hypothetical protein